MVALWYHDNMRIFHDRLIDEEDRTMLKKMLTDEFDSFGVKHEEILNVERIIFGDYMQGKDVEPRHYC
jgi:dynein heavy chain